MIIEYLDFYNIFKVMRVSRAFRGTIIGSVRLQRKLLLLPQATTDPDKPLLEPGTNRPVENNFIYQVFDDILDIGLPTPSVWYKGAARNQPWWCEAHGPYLQLWFDIPWYRVRKLIDRYYSLPGWHHRDFAGAKLTKRGSWAETRITASPMPVHVRFEMDEEETGEWYNSDYVLISNEATLGRLYDIGILALEELANDQIKYSDRNFCLDPMPGVFPPD